MSLKAPSVPVDGTCGPRQRSIELALPVERHALVGDPLDDLDLVAARPSPRRARSPRSRGISWRVTRRFRVDDLAHRRLDALEVFGSERLGALEVVVEAVLDDRADRDLRAGKEPLHGLRHEVRGRVPEHLEPLRASRAAPPRRPHPVQPRRKDREACRRPARRPPCRPLCGRGGRGDRRGRADFEPCRRLDPHARNATAKGISRTTRLRDTGGRPAGSW